MKKNIFFVIQLKKNGKFIAIALAVPKSHNLYHYFDDYNKNGCSVVVVHYCDAYKDALELASVWNNGFKNNGSAWEETEFAD